jgi:uncharacterized membrane protein
MDQETLGRTIGWAGAICGTLLGILGGAIGVYFSVKNTKGPRERAFVIRASILCLVGVVIFVVGMWLVPSPYKFGLIPVYVVALLLGMRQWNRRQAAIRAEESDHAA